MRCLVTMVGHTPSPSKMWVCFCACWLPQVPYCITALLVLKRVQWVRTQGRWVWLTAEEHGWGTGISISQLLLFPIPRFCWPQQWQILRGSLCICKGAVKGEWVECHYCLGGPSRQWEGSLERRLICLSQAGGLGWQYSNIHAHLPLKTM